MSSSTKLNVDSSGVEVSPTLYRSIIGRLLYLTASRPDFTFSVGVCARYQAAPKESHLTVVKRIIWYINGTPNYGLWYSKDSNACLAGYSDADWLVVWTIERVLQEAASTLVTILSRGWARKKFRVSLYSWSRVHSRWKLLHTTSLDEEVTWWLWNSSRYNVCFLW